MLNELPYEKSIKSYLSISSDLEVTKELLNKKSVNNIAELFGYADCIKSQIPEIGESSGFLNYLNSIKTLSAQIAFRVLTTPSAYHWNAMTRLLLNALISKQRSETLNHYLKFLGLNPEEGLKAHLNDFGRFTVSAHILSETDYESGIPLAIKLPNTFPGTKLALLSSEGDGDFHHWVELSSLRSSLIKQLYKLSQLETTEPIRLDIENNQTVLIHRMPGRKGIKEEIIIDSFEPCLNLRYVENYPRIKTNERTRKFVNIR